MFDWRKKIHLKRKIKVKDENKEMMNQLTCQTRQNLYAKTKPHISTKFQYYEEEKAIINVPEEDRKDGANLLSNRIGALILSRLLLYGGESQAEVIWDEGIRHSHISAYTILETTRAVY